MPDSLETRVARLEQRLEDTILRMDARLLDLASDVRALSPLVIAHAEMAVKLTTAVEEAKAAHAAVEALDSYLNARDQAEREQQAAREKAQRDERKKDRQWLFMAMIAAVMMIIAATALLVG